MRRGNGGHVGPCGMSCHADTEDMLLHVAAAKRHQAEQMQPKKGPSVVDCLTQSVDAGSLASRPRDETDPDGHK